MRDDLMTGEVTPADVWSPPHTRPAPTGAPPNGTPIAVVAHPYNVYDPYVNHCLLARLEDLGASVMTPERLGARPGADYRAFEHELIGAAKLAIGQRLVRGLVAVVAFGCGPDGVMQESLLRLQTVAPKDAQSLAPGRRAAGGSWLPSSSGLTWSRLR